MPACGSVPKSMLTLTVSPATFFLGCSNDNKEEGKKPGKGVKKKVKITKTTSTIKGCFK